MFTRTESFRDFLRLYPVISLLVAIHLVIYLAISLPFLPGDFVFSSLAGVNFYISAGEYWRLVTPIFVHAGFSHFLFNSFSLVLFGPALERMLGKIKFITIYLTAGIGANIATFLLEPPNYIHVGASGAIFGLFGYYIAIAIFQKHKISGENSQTIITIAVISVIMTFVQPNINITAHIFGMLAGFLIGRATSK